MQRRTALDRGRTYRPTEIYAIIVLDGGRRTVGEENQPVVVDPSIVDALLFDPVELGVPSLEIRATSISPKRPTERAQPAPAICSVPILRPHGVLPKDTVS